MPIKTPEGQVRGREEIEGITYRLFREHFSPPLQVIGVAQVINKIQGEGVFTKEDEEVGKLGRITHS